MALKYYIPLSIGIFAAAIAGVRYTPVPVLPVAIIVLVSETFLGLQAENGKVARMASELLGALRTQRK